MSSGQFSSSKRSPTSSMVALGVVAGAGDEVMDPVGIVERLSVVNDGLVEPSSGRCRSVPKPAASEHALNCPNPVNKSAPRPKRGPTLLESATGAPAPSVCLEPRFENSFLSAGSSTGSRISELRLSASATCHLSPKPLRNRKRP